MHGAGPAVPDGGLQAAAGGVFDVRAHIVYHHGMRWQTAGITISDVAKNSQKLMLKVRDYAAVDRFPWKIRMCRDASGVLGWTNGSRWEIASEETLKLLWDAWCR